MKIAEGIAARKKPFYSLEFYPPKEEAQRNDFFATAEKLTVLDPLFVSVTYGAGGSSQNATLDITAQLKREGFNPMPHLTCVGASSERILQFLDAADAAGIDNILALRGDPPRNQPDWKPEGNFVHAEDLVNFVRAHKPGMDIGVAGYPAPHPESPSFASDRRHLSHKIASGASFVVTQLFFDCREYFALVEHLAFQGIHVPVIPGILPIASLDSVRRTLSMCGANIPGAFYLQLEQAHAQGGVEAVKEVGFAFAVEQIRTLLQGGAPGVHLYTLNRAETCLRIMQEVGPLGQ